MTGAKLGADLAAAQRHNHQRHGRDNHQHKLTGARLQGGQMLGRFDFPRLGRAKDNAARDGFDLGDDKLHLAGAKPVKTAGDTGFQKQVYHRPLKQEPEQDHDKGGHQYHQKRIGAMKPYQRVKPRPVTPDRGGRLTVPDIADKGEHEEAGKGGCGHGTLGI